MGGLWEKGTDCINDVRLTDIDSKSCRSKDVMKALADRGNKKKKYAQPCLATKMTT